MGLSDVRLSLFLCFLTFLSLLSFLSQPVLLSHRQKQRYGFHLCVNLPPPFSPSLLSFIPHSNLCFSHFRRYDCHCERDKPERSNFTHQTPKHLFSPPLLSSRPKYPFLSLWVSFPPSVLPRFIFFFIRTLVPLPLLSAGVSQAGVSVSYKRKSGWTMKRRLSTHRQNKTKQKKQKHSE